MAYATLPISYCANVHPGDTFTEAHESLKRYAAPLRQRLDRPIAVGLWMTRNAVNELAASPGRVDDLKHWLHDAGLTCYTMNAFPFGNFHAERVKENVYLPDWTSEERTSYTCQVAEVLARLLPDGIEGSISTSPCAFKSLHPKGADVSIYFPQLIETARRLAELRERTGRVARLAIEPEPCCVLETTNEAVAFFHELRHHVAGQPVAAAVHEHLGLCYDVCHQAVEFENVAESIDKLAQNEIRINKLHITCALELNDPADPAARAHLARFVEQRYLHQTFAAHPNGKTLSLVDLTEGHALHPPAEWLDCPIWRIHFHVPVNEEQLGPLGTTRPVLVEALQRVGKLDYAPHLEVETYTWNVMPGHERQSFDLVAGLQAELESTIALLDELRTGG